MTSLQWQSATLALRGHHTLVIPELCLTPQACWAFVGSNGSGKTALASALCGELVVRTGVVTGRVRAERLSFESQQQLGERDFQRRNTDMLGEEEEAGYQVSTLMLEEGGEETQARSLLARFGIESLWDRPYRYLSSGEGRKLLLARPLVKHPPLLILDEPLQGLDPLNRHLVRALVVRLIGEGSQLLFVSHHPEDAPPGLTHRLYQEKRGATTICRSVWGAEPPGLHGQRGAGSARSGGMPSSVHHSPKKIMIPSQSQAR